MIVSRNNRRLKDIRRLRKCKEKRRALLEGPNLIAEAHAAGFEIEYVLATPDFLAGAVGRWLRHLLLEPPIETAPQLLAEVADADSPRGVVAAARLPQWTIRALPDRIAGPFVLAEGLQDPGNLGALARVAEASGSTGLALGRAAHGSVQPHHPRALRASAGSLLRLPLAIDVSLAELEERYAVQSPKKLALVAHGGQDLQSIEAADPVILAIGAEGEGLTRETLDRCDLEVTIDLEAPVESLNSTVAAAVVLFELRRRARPESARTDDRWSTPSSPLGSPRSKPERPR
jgi:TrmH family RNA methyltransferase